MNKKKLLGAGYGLACVGVCALAYVGVYPSADAFAQELRGGCALAFFLGACAFVLTVVQEVRD